MRGGLLMSAGWRFLMSPREASPAKIDVRARVGMRRERITIG